VRHVARPDVSREDLLPCHLCEPINAISQRTGGAGQRRWRQQLLVEQSGVGRAAEWREKDADTGNDAARSTSRREGSSARELRSAIRIESTPSSAASHSVLDLAMRATCRLPRSVALDAQDQLKGASERRTSVEITGSFGRQY
jgi:hypothetical protein